MTKPDDLNIGDFVAVVSHIDGPVQTDGMPYKVKAISLPFVAVEDVKAEISAFDVRYWNVQKLSPQYASVMGFPAVRKSKCRRVVTQDVNMLCPNCGERICERRIIGQDSRVGWVPWCRTCEKVIRERH